MKRLLLWPDINNTMRHYYDPDLKFAFAYKTIIICTIQMLWQVIWSIIMIIGLSL